MRAIDPKEQAMNQLKPEHPQEADVEEKLPDQSHLEGAELLANDARSSLRAKGFTDDEVDEWALTYIADEGSGDVESFEEWIAAKEQRSVDEP